MFKFLLAFLVWLFATGKYNDWFALVTTSNASASGNASSAASSGSTSSGSNSLSSLLSGLDKYIGGATASGSENAGASSTSTPDDLISGFTG